MREITIEPAFDRRHANPAKNYGIHGCNLRFLLKGPLGAVQFVLYTNWQLPHVTEEQLARSYVDDDIGLRVTFLPLPADLGYHSPTARYANQRVQSDDCPVIGGPCYYDGSGLNAEPVYERLLREGSDGVWKALEEYYAETFAASESAA